MWAYTWLDTDIGTDVDTDFVIIMSKRNTGTYPNMKTSLFYISIQYINERVVLILDHLESIKM